MINEIDSSAPTALQAVKLLAMYLSFPENKVGILFSFGSDFGSDFGFCVHSLLRMLLFVLSSR